MRRGITIQRMVVAIAVLVGVLAIAIPYVASRTAKADVASARADLQALVTAQESWFYERATYAPSVEALKATPSEGVTLTIVAATATGWSATAVRAGGVRATCAVFYGAAAPVPPATVAGQIACE